MAKLLRRRNLCVLVRQFAAGPTAYDQQQDILTKTGSFRRYLVNDLGNKLQVSISLDVDVQTSHAGAFGRSVTPLVFSRCGAINADVVKFAVC